MTAPSEKDPGGNRKTKGGRKKMVRADAGRRARGRSARRDAGARKEPRKRQAARGSAAPREVRARQVTSRQAAKRSRPSSESRRQGVAQALLFRITRLSPRTVVWVVLAVFFVALSISPVSRNLEATARLKKAEGELARQRSVTRSLEQEVEEAKGLEYVEMEARRQRLVAPGEVLYLVTTGGEQKVEYRVKALQSMDEAWERVRGMLHCGASRKTGGK